MEFLAGKRLRGGSISGRLRAVSDLEDKGVIDRVLKGILKDRIISGDKTLEDALDSFEKGNAATLEGMILRGELLRGESIDFLESLDLDFLKSDFKDIPDNSNELEFNMMNDNFDVLDSPNKSRESDDKQPLSYKDMYDLQLTGNNPNSSDLFAMPMFPPKYRVRNQSIDHVLSILYPLEYDKIDTTLLSGELFEEPDRHCNIDQFIFETKEDQLKKLNKTKKLQETVKQTAPDTSSIIPISISRPLEYSTSHIGSYSPETRRSRIERFLQKRSRRIWTKRVKYDVRKNFADSRIRVKGRFVKKEEEELLRELQGIV
jgi:hypothetical protein